MSNLFVNANGATICLSRLTACVPVVDSDDYYTLYFDTGLTAIVSKDIANGLVKSLQWLPKFPTKQLHKDC